MGADWGQLLRYALQDLAILHLRLTKKDDLVKHLTLNYIFPSIMDLIFSVSV